MSGGEQQMLAVGRALMAKPKLLLLDEPSMGLAPVLVDVIFQTIARVREQGVTVLLVEQNALAALQDRRSGVRPGVRAHEADRAGRPVGARPGDRQGVSRRLTGFATTDTPAGWRGAGRPPRRCRGVRLGSPGEHRQRPDCCCWTATRWPTGRSSPCPWRTSPPRTGQPTNAVYGFTSMLINVLRDEQPTHIVVAFDVSRAVVPHRAVRRVQGQPRRDARPTSPARSSLVKEVLGGAAASRWCEKAGYEADDVIATLATPGPRGRHAGAASAPATGTRSSSSTRRGHRALPQAGRLRAGPDDPGRGDRTLRRRPRALPRPGGAGRRDQRQPARRARASGRRPPPSGSRSTAGSTAWSRTSTRSRARPATACASTWPGCCATTSSTGWSTTSSCRCDPTDAPWRGWDREAVHQVFDALQFRVLRDRLYEYLDAVEPEAEAGFDLDGEVLGAGAGGRLARPSTPDRGAGRRGRVGPVRPGHRRAHRGRGGHRRRPGRPGSTRPRSSPTTTRRWPPGSPIRPGPRCSTTPSRRCSPSPRTAGRCAGLATDTALAAYLARPDQRSYDLTDLALRYLHRELRVEGPTTASSPSTGWADDGEVEQNLMLRARATLDLADAIDAELTRDGDSRRRLLREVEQPLVDVLAGDGAGRHRRRHRLPVRAGGALRGRGEGGGAGGVRGGRAGVQPRLAQAAAGDPVRRAGPAQDQADQDRVHHRRRRARSGCTRRPSTRCWSTCCATATWPS